MRPDLALQKSIVSLLHYDDACAYLIKHQLDFNVGQIKELSDFIKTNWTRAKYIHKPDLKVVIS